MAGANEPGGPSGDRRPGLVEIFKSVGAAFFGVQSEAKRERDFTHGRLSDYVIAGAVATVVFILVLVGVVQLVLHLAGA
jgi:hypothetical protein